MRNLFTVVAVLLFTGCKKPADFKIQDVINTETEQTGDGDIAGEGIIVCHVPEGWSGDDLKDWREYLEKNLQPDSALLETIPDGIYKGFISFEVETDGRIINASVQTDPGYGLGQFALNIIQQYRKKPAVANRFATRAFHRQPVTFMIGQ